MAISGVSFFVMVLLAMIVSVVAVDAQNLAPAPPPTSDGTKSGTSVDQGIAYVLMLVALVLTYLIHPLDASYNFF
ncbi:hypothetical protein Sjap_005246 [Stephania japonica]|uniref:Uncharacterized protein n=1 Tax=Stephania japonica TaxID=461633 RepID=A0AAP0PHP5_9MAGN